MDKEKSANKLPEGWVWTTIGEIGIVYSGGTPSTRDSEYWGDMIPWITPADLSNYNGKYITKGQRGLTQEGLDYSSAKLLPKGSILFSSRAPIGYVVIAKNEIATNQGFKNLIPTKSLNSEYVYYYFRTLKSLAEKVASGTTFLELSASKFSQLPFPLPPLKEQYSIVSKIEELFSELEHAEKGLQKAKQQLKVYRQALLKNAFEGKLTNIPLDQGKLPSSWRLIEFESFCKLQRGHDLPLSNIIPGKYPVVTSSGINGYHNNYKANGPCLVTGRSGNVGNVFYFDIDKFWPHNTVLYVKDFCNNNPKFVYYFFLQFNFQSFSASTAVPTLDRKKLYKELVPLPEYEEQKQIVQEIESRFSLIENLEKSINKSLNDAEVFRHSILKQAFEGKLVSQNPSDEPANLLLQQIKVEKEVYLKVQIEVDKLKPQKKRTMENIKTVLELLQDANEPIAAEKLWQKSVHKDNIEDFYAELKQIEEKVEEIREGKLSKLILKK